MRLNRKQAFGIAGIIAVGVAILVYYLLSSSTKTQQAEQPQMTGVVISTTNIPAYTTITSGMVEIKSVAVSAAPPNALTSVGQAVGQLAQYAIPKGQVLVRGDVVVPDATQGLTFVIPKGKRAVTVALDPITGVAGFVYPCDHVDILATFERDDVSSTRVILQNIEVLAMNEQTIRPNHNGAPDSGTEGQNQKESPAVEKVKSATLAVTPEEAQRLILAISEGSIHMILRSREDDSNGVHNLAATTDWGLMGKDEPVCDVPEPAAPQPVSWPPAYMAPPGPAAPAQPAAPAAPTIEIIRGSEHSTVEIDQ